MRIFQKAKIAYLCNRYGIKKYTINEDLTVDIMGSVSLDGKGLNKLPFQFGNVNGTFSCVGNNLKSLEGSPKSVVRHFHCSSNDLLSLKGAPYKVGGTFVCQNNYLNNLEGSPKSIGGALHCERNKITTLEGFPSYLGYNLYCNENPIYELWKLFNDVSKIELFNDYDIIRDECTDHPKIVLERLNAFLEDIGSSKRIMCNSKSLLRGIYNYELYEI